MLLTHAPPDLRAEIYVRGSRPAQFLAGNASARKQLKKNMAVQGIFDAQVDDPLMTVSQYMAAFAADVRVVDLEKVAPDVFA